MPQMQAQWTQTTRGLPWDVLTLTTGAVPTLPPPVPLPKDAAQPEEWLLIDVAFAALNPGAIWQMVLLPDRMRAANSVPEMDLSGTVVDVWHPDETAKEGARFAVGDKICAMLPAAFLLPTGNGALAKRIRIPAKYAVHKPRDTTFAHGAGAMLAGLTARQLVLESGAKTGDRVLINAASGGIGHLVVQMVRNAVGPTGFVVGVCGAAKAEMIKSLGADETIDYAAHSDLGAHLTARFGASPFDVVIDVLGKQALYAASPRFLVPGGLYESVGIKPPGFSIPDFLRAVWKMKLNEWWPTTAWLGGVGRKWGACAMMSPTLADRQAVVDMLERKEIKVVIDSIFAFEEADKAYRRLGEGHAAGKIVVKVDPAIGDNEC